MSLKTAGSIFQRLMSDTLHGLLDDGIFCYLNEVTVAADTAEKHLDRLERIFLRLRSTRLKLKPSKCNFLESQLGYLGHVLSSAGLKTDPINTEAIENFPRPTNQQQVRSFYGLVSYYRRFIKNFGSLSSGLVPLLKKDAIFIWTDKAQKSFEFLKLALATPPILHYPDISKKEYYIETDGSIEGVGAILSQPMNDGKKQSGPIAYASRVLNEAETNYPITEIEALACVYAAKQFKSYISGSTVHIITSRAALTPLLHQKELGLHRWVRVLGNYNIVWRYRKGTQNRAVDALPRASAGLPSAEGLDEWTECYSMTMKGAKLNSGVKSITTRSKKQRLQKSAPSDRGQMELGGDELIDEIAGDKNTAGGGGKQGAADEGDERGATNSESPSGLMLQPSPPSSSPPSPPLEVTHPEKDTLQKKKQKCTSPLERDEATMEQLRAQLLEAQGEAKQWEEAVKKHKFLLEEALGRGNGLERQMRERKVTAQQQLRQV
ncbi:MAG: hypothetical protein GY820_35860, partial [Gammaproteobacteria bacterium]|nr:hypothetical protein [Gammaproteobacteria bacterium]